MTRGFLEGIVWEKLHATVALQYGTVPRPRGTSALASFTAYAHGPSSAMSPSDPILHSCALHQEEGHPVPVIMD